MKVSWTVVSAHHTTHSERKSRGFIVCGANSSGSIVQKKKQKTKQNGDLLVNKPVPVEC